MKKRNHAWLLGLFSCWLLQLACAVPGQIGQQTPSGKSPDYPPGIENTPAHEISVNASWRAFLAEKQLPENVRFASEPGLLSPRAWPQELAGNVQLTPAATLPSDLEIKEALRRFIEKNARWLGVNAGDTAIGLPDLSLVTFSRENNLVRVTYEQRSFLHPVVEGYGELQFTLSKSGSLLQLSSRILPPVTLPTQAKLEANTLPERFVNREFSYSNIAGQPLKYQVERPDEVFVKALVVYPHLQNGAQGDRLTVHLAYPVVVGRGTTWTVYVDAITGEELAVKANFTS